MLSDRGGTIRARPAAATRLSGWAPASATTPATSMAGMKALRRKTGRLRRWASGSAASAALMQGLADGYFVLPYTITHWLAGVKP